MDHGVRLLPGTVKDILKLNISKLMELAQQQTKPVVAYLCYRPEASIENRFWKATLKSGFDTRGRWYKKAPPTSLCCLTKKTVLSGLRDAQGLGRMANHSMDYEALIIHMVL